jgi:amidohydrolase
MKEEKMNKTIINENELLTEMIGHRRKLHMIPELGHSEFKTQRYIIEHIESLGLKYQTLNTSVIVDLVVNEDFNTVALRADIDALALKEENDCEYCSTHKGAMHACGHDAHTAINLGLASYFTSNQEDLNLNIRFIFQCDEENNGGAEEICDAGYLNDVNAVFGLHVDPSLEVGQIGYKYGQMNAGGDEINIIVEGKQAHGAYPQFGIDAIVCASHIISNLQTIVSRRVSPTDSTVVTFGTIHGNGTPNTICNKVVMEGTVRNLNPETRKFTTNKVMEQAKLIGDAHDCNVTFEYMPSYPPLINHDNYVDYVVENTKALGYEAVDLKVPSLGLEDFAYYVEQVPGVFYDIGCKIKGDEREIHNSKFDIDENCLLVGAKVQISNIMNYHKQI